jgi:hypothetical protein
LENLEKKHTEIAEQIVLENTKERMQLTKDDIFKYLKLAITKKPKQMIDMIVKEVKLYKDKIEIFFKYNRLVEEETKNESIYSTTKEVQIEYNPEPTKINIDILV